MPVEALFGISEPGESQTKQVCKGRAVGIDLGTTHSLVAVVQAGQPVCLCGGQSALLPSVVHYAKDGGVVVGQEAQRLALAFPRDTIASVKRFMGRGPDDAEAKRKLVPYAIAPSSPGDSVSPPARRGPYFARITGYQGTTPLPHFPWVIWNRVPIQTGSFQRMQAASA